MNFETYRKLLKSRLVKRCTEFKSGRLTIKQWAQLDIKLSQLSTKDELVEFENKYFN